MKDRPYSTREAADFLGVSFWTLTRWRKIGEGPRWVKLGARRIAYRLSALEAYVAENTHGHGQ
ncbi:helix-turn-helix transcriptional regulator [Qipengyuania mesophila]|uniref:helix-turn-helix transcriptional regulator n=1 Tax=Qipengyuania mesophila TaxID=2867246 RepID=UPI0035176DF6